MEGCKLQFYQIYDRHPIQGSDLFLYIGKLIMRNGEGDSQMKFMDFLIQEYCLSESSAKDYVGRFNGIVNRGIYKEEHEMTPILKAAVEKEFPNSKNHYVLALERYIEFQRKRKNKWKTHKK